MLNFKTQKMKKNSLIAGLLCVGFSALSQVDNNKIFDANFTSNFHDKSSSALQAEVHGNVTKDKNRFNQADKAAFFDGKQSSYLSFGKPDHLKNNNDFSVNLWYKGGTSDNGDYETLLSKFDLNLGLYDMNAPTFEFIHDAEWYSKGYDQQIKKLKFGYDSTSWHNLVAIKKSDSLFLYRDSKFIGKSIDKDRLTSDSVLIGRGFKGTIDNVTIYEGVLSKEEISWLFNNNEEVNQNGTNCDGSIIVNGGNGLRKNINPNPNTFIFCYSPFGKEGYISFSINNGSSVFQTTVENPKNEVAILNQNSLKITEAGNYKLTLLSTTNCVYGITITVLENQLNTELLSFNNNFKCIGVTDSLFYSAFQNFVPPITLKLYKNDLFVKEVQNITPTQYFKITDGGMYYVEKTDFTCQYPEKSNQVYVVEKNCTVTSLFDTEAEMLNVHPNPTIGVLHVSGVEEGTKINVISMLGNSTIYTIQNQQVDISNLDSGVYTLLVPTKNGVVSKKVILD